ncbi:MAG: DegT/DnrJ/EryC1/StrS family aminotransferase [Planctomycetes bacterium]|nr:DegT/DnrJ/EryC1/StrS family aminotransferase [Planctomycetota bacterium]
MRPVKGKKASSGGDFRYSAGPARVPWHAVGEPFSQADAMSILEFLLPPGESPAKYRRRLGSVRRAVLALARESGRATKLTLGKQVEQAEKEARRFLKVKHACYLTNWTAGMEIGYKLSGLRPGDEVIIPSITFVATMAYPLLIGAKVVFADVDPRTLNLDPRYLERKITSRTRVIVPVHVGGFPCDMDRIMSIARRRDIYVMEDAAHGFGATYKGRQLGTIGHFGGYSFHEVKNINSLGEGGLLVTNLPCGEQFKKARFLGLDFSRTIPNWLYDVSALEDRFGRPQAPGNHSATEIQGLAFRLQFARIQKIIAARRKAAAFLASELAGEPGLLPPPKEGRGTRSSCHLYLLRVDPRTLRADIQALKAKLSRKGVTQIPHFGPLYKFDIVRKFGYDPKAIAKTCPNTEEVFNHGFTHLPLYPLTGQQLRYMAKAVKESVRQLRAGK